MSRGITNGLLAAIFLCAIAVGFRWQPLDRTDAEAVDVDDRPRDAAENCQQQDHVLPPGRVLKIAGLGS